MEQRSRTALVAHFSALEDPRQQAKVLYPLPEIVLLLLCATLAGADDFVEMGLWGKQNLVFLRRFLAYEHGVPSHDTLGEVIRVVDPDLFRACFTSWVEGLRQDAPDIVAIDGKTSRRSHARRHGRAPLHLVSAWASRQRLVLGQQAVAGKSNEIVAIPLLLDRLALAGALVTIDAIGTQNKIAGIILARGGDYLLAVLRSALCRRARLPGARRHRHGRGRDRARWQDQLRAALLSRLSAARRQDLRPRGARPLAHRKSPALGPRCSLPRRPRPLEDRPRPRKHGRRQTHGHEHPQTSQANHEPQKPPKTRRMEPRLPR